LINSRLLSKPERRDPVRLRENEGKSFQGSKIYGQGFTLTPDERDALIRRNPKNGELIFPYIGGREVNTSPTQNFHRYVINFGSMSLEDAARWPDLLTIVREKVKPERDRLRDNPTGLRLRAFWWQFGAVGPGLHGAIAPLTRLLVTSRVTSHLCFSFQPPDRVFSDKLCVYPIADYATLAVLQSRIHESWARLLSSTMKNDLSYAPSDCFDTFPFPRDVSTCEAAGRALYEARAAYMVKTQQGLTKTYNRIKDPACVDPPVVELRRLHEAMDRSVLAAYGWHDSPSSDEIIDRLYELNQQEPQCTLFSEIPHS